MMASAAQGNERMKEEIGFIHGVPENPDKTWEKQISGRTFIFKKERVGKNGIFLYNCSQYSENDRFTSASSTGFHSDRNLMPEEVERLPQFAGFISDCARFAFPLKVNRR
jgi:hypothetical protein